MLNRKIITIIILLGLCSVGFTENDNFKLELSFKRKEKSKDSNWEITSILISDNHIKYSCKYGGFRAPEDEHNNKKVDSNIVKKIVDYIKRSGLNKNISEKRKTDGIGVAGFLNLEIQIAGRKTLISIEGKTNIWGTDDYVKREWGRKYVKNRTNIKNIEYINKAEDFIRIIKMIFSNPSKAAKLLEAD